MAKTTPIQLSDHFTYRRLIRFTVPSIAMMIFTSIYGVVDGVFVSNYVGGTPFAALNLIMPFIMIFSAIGFMFGTGGSALVAFTLGTGRTARANEIFSLIIALVAGIGLLLSALGWITAAPVARLLGATETMLPYCVLYARINMLGLVPFMLQNTFQSFLITAEKPKIGLWVTVAAGVVNMVLDWLLMGVLHMGLGSAAAATVIGQFVGGGIPLVYFLLPNHSLLRLGRTHFHAGWVVKAATNGSSEFMTNISMSVVNMLYNFQLMRYAGENGVSAYGIIMYTNFIFVGVFLGYSFGVAPVAGYHCGAGNRKELSSVFRKSITMIGIAAVCMTLLSELLAPYLSMIFARYDPALMEMTTHAIRIYCLSFLLMGFNMFGSSFFTALNNGLVSALISFLRTLVFEVLSVLLLPELMGLSGVWGAIVSAELLSILVTGFCLWHFRQRYGYWSWGENQRA